MTAYSSSSTRRTPLGDEAARELPPEAALVSLALEDPQRGLAAMYDTYSVEVNRLVWRLLGPDPDTEDIVQLVFLKMLQSIGRLRAPERLHFWIRSITMNVVRSELRKRMVRRAFARQHQQDEPTADLNMDVESREFIQRSAKVLDRLPVKERIVFTLYYLEELSLPEIAEICGYSLMTAKRRLSSARTRFKNIARSEPLFRSYFKEVHVS